MTSLLPVVLFFSSAFAFAADPVMQPLPKGCVKTFDDLKSPDAKATVDMMNLVANPPSQKPLVNGWNQFLGDWTLAVKNDETASAIITNNDGLSGKIITKNSKTGAVTSQESGRIAICNNGGRLEIWMLDASLQKGYATVLLMRSRIANQVDFTPLTGKYAEKGLTLPFQKGSAGPNDVAAGGAVSR